VSVATKNGEIDYAENEEARAAYLAARALGEESAQRRRALWGDGGAAAMTRLCNLFPSLRNAYGVDPWDSMKMLSFACSGASHGALCAARFVLSVWNTVTDWNEEAHTAGILTDEEDRLRRFDVFEALGVWDFEHHKAFLTWVRDPFWP
jgi:hypothetical protein